MKAGNERWAARRFCYESVSIRVQSSEPAHLEWLEEFLRPDFDVDAGGRADYEVRVEISTGGYLELRRAGPAPDRRGVDCFALDGSMVRLPVWASGPDQLVVFEHEYHVFYLVSADRGTICIVAPRGRLSARNSLMRVVRELAMLGTEPRCAWATAG